jgi:hypothetical protein
VTPASPVFLTAEPTCPSESAFVSEQVLSVDDDPRGIIWSEGGSGTTTFLVDGSTKSIRNRERRAALARASELLKQLTSSLMPLAAESAEPEDGRELVKEARGLK